MTTVTEDDFRTHCLQPAVALRQRLRDQLNFLDPGEFTNYEITVQQNLTSTNRHELVLMDDASEGVAPVDLDEMHG